MLFDAQLRPSNAQSLAGAAATTVSTNSVDLLSENVNLGRGQPMRAIALAAAAFTGGTSVQGQIVQSDNSDLSSPDVLVSGPTVLEANLGLGAVIMDVPMPNNTKRYMGMRYVTVGTHTTGSVTSGFVSDTDNQPYVPSNTGR